MGWIDDVCWDGDPEEEMFNYHGGVVTSKKKQCKHCGKGELFWKEVTEKRNGKTKSRWQLFDNEGKAHYCQVRKV